VLFAVGFVQHRCDGCGDSAYRVVYDGISEGPGL
jgi:hypothetical protein